MAKANINNRDGFSSSNEELSVDKVVQAVVVSNSELEILQRYSIEPSAKAVGKSTFHPFTLLSLIEEIVSVPEILHQ